MLTVNEVAERLRLTPNTIYRWLEAGRIEGATKLPNDQWRIPESVVEGLLAPSMDAEVSEGDAKDAGAVVD